MMKPEDYIALGWYILPVSKDKRPLTKHGVHDATNDPLQFQFDGCNLGVSTGSRSGIIVIDIDPRNGGHLCLQSVVRDIGPLPRTLVQYSGGGGTHLVYKYPGFKLKSKLCDGVDVLSDNKYFLAEPSVHPSGGKYEWASDPGFTEIAVLPERYLDILRRPELESVDVQVRVATPEIIRRAQNYVNKIPSAIWGKGRTFSTFKVAGILTTGFLLSDSDALPIFQSYNRRCKPPWSDQQLINMLKNSRKTIFRPGYLL